MIGLWLRAGRRFACFLSCRVALSLGARSLSSCLRFGFSSIGSPCFSACLVGSRLSPPGPVLYSSPCSLSRAFPTACLLSAPRLIRRVRLCRRPLSDCPRLVDSVAVPCHPIDAVPCFSPSVSAFRFFPRFFPLASHPLCAPCVSSSLLGSSPFPVPPCLVVSRPDCRSACFAHLGLVSGLPSCGHRAVCPVPPFVPLCLSEDGAACCAVVSYRLGRLVA